MAVLTSNASINNNNLTINGTDTQYATISWITPIPSGTITLCGLSGKVIIEMEKGSVTVNINGNPYKSSGNFSVNLGTSNAITSLTINAKGNIDDAKGTVTFSDLVYTVRTGTTGGGTSGVKNIYIGDISIENIYMGNSQIEKVYLGDIQIYDISTSGSDEPIEPIEIIDISDEIVDIEPQEITDTTYITDGLALYLNAKDLGASGTIKDLSGNNTTIINHNVPTTLEKDSINFVANNEAYLECDISPNVTQWSVEFYFYYDGNGSVAETLCSWGSSGDRITIGYWGNSFMVANIDDTELSIGSYSNYSTLNHVIITFNNGTMTSYTNGIKKVLSTSTGVRVGSSDTNFMIGTKYNKSGDFGNFNLKSFRFYNGKTLTDDEVLSNYNSTVVSGTLLYKFGLLSDTHIDGDGDDYGDSISDLTNALTYFEEENCSFVAHCGDMTYDGRTEDFNALKTILDSSNIPNCTIRGNHDAYSLSNGYTNATGRVEDYIINKGNELYIFMSMANTDAGGTGGITQAKLSWLSTLLTTYDAERMFLFYHVPVRGTCGDGGGWLYPWGMIGDTTNNIGTSYKNLIKSCPNLIVINGHSHFKFDFQNRYPNANYYHNNGECYYVHVPSCARPRIEDTSSSDGIADWEAGSEGFLVEVYTDRIVFKPRDFISGQFLTRFNYVIPL